jgi:serine/threonine protein kinase
MAALPGSRLGPYEIGEPLGAGGMGEVYRARDTRLDRIVAVKILPAELAADPEARERFEREARTISQINHPHICTLHDVGREGGIDYLVFEYLEGETLAHRIARGALPVAQALRIAIDICDGLDTAHQLHITHRDLKPGNVMLIKGGTARSDWPQAKLLDFGLAKARVALMAPGAVVSSATDGLTGIGGPLTARGTILGTIQYMAPEQIEGGDADARTDIWAFGCILYEMLSGAAPFGGASQASLMAAILERQPRPLPEALPSISPRLWEALRVCLEKDPANRWQSARDLLREIKWIAQDLSAPAGKPLPARSGGAAVSRRAVLAGSVGILALGVAGAWWTSHSSSSVPARTGPPVVVLMDSPHPERVYDAETRKAGGTNADDLTDLLRDLPVVLFKESTSASWHREREVLEANPALIVAHRSAFYDTTLFEPGKYGDVGHTAQFAALAHDKFDSFVGYIAQGNPQTRFVVYSRGSWADEAGPGRWVTTMEQRFPALRGRVDAMKVPADRATFRDPLTGADIKKRIRSMMRLDH